jgi:hypothetical protein
MSVPRVLGFLWITSCLYVGLPWMLFLVGWLRWYWAWPAVAALIAAGLGMVRRSAQASYQAPEQASDDPFSSVEASQGEVRQCRRFSPAGGARGSRERGCRFSLWGEWLAGMDRRWVLQAVLWSAVALMLVSLSGAGGVGLQEGDYFKHNAVLKGLIESPWPVWVPTPQGAFPLVYYLGWYLPAAAVGKLWGWEAANVFMFIWTYWGVLLALGWFALLVGRCSPVVLAVFFLFSAPDVVGAAWMKLIGWDPGPPLPPPIRDAWGINWYALRWWNWELRWWAGPYTWNYCSHMELLFWVPQQALGAWITTGMMVAGFWQPGIGWRRWALVPIALSALWSPLVSLGLLPCLAAELFRLRETGPTGPNQNASTVASVFRWGSLGGSCRPTELPALAGWFDWPNAAALVLLGVAGLYYAAHFGPLPFSNDPRAEFRFLGFDDWPIGVYLLRLVFFWGIDVGALVGLILLVRPPRPGRERILFGTAVGVLLGLALFRYGLNNDLGMRVSIPWLFVLGVLLAKGAVRRRLPAMRRWIFWGALAIMAATPIAEVYRHLCEMRRQGRWVNIPPAAQVQSLWELNAQTRQKSGNDFFIRQYIGRPGAPFFRYLAPPCVIPAKAGI